MSVELIAHAIDVAGSGSVSSVLLRPVDARALLVFAHGAGAGMRHIFMEGVARALAGRAIATLRYQFPYTEKGSRRPDRAPVCEATVRAAVAAAAALAPDLPLLAGGKSMGGRMTSQAHAAAPLPSVRALVFFGFPLHPAGGPFGVPARSRGDTGAAGSGRAPSLPRADHLAAVALPMLFLQGTRDDLADLALLRPVIAALGPRAELSILDGADHSFGVGARATRRGDAAIAELAARAAAFALAVTTPAAAARR